MKSLLLIVLMAVCMPFGRCSDGQPDNREKRKDLTGYVFKDTTAQDRRFSDFKGDYIYVEVWSMSCGVCLQEMPYFHRLAKKYDGKGIQFVSICVDNNLPIWTDYLKRKKIGGTQWNTKLFSPFLKENGLIALPGFVLIDQTGKMIWANKLRPSNPALEEELDKLLAGKL